MNNYYTVRGWKLVLKDILRNNLKAFYWHILQICLTGEVRNVDFSQYEFKNIITHKLLSDFIYLEGTITTVELEIHDQWYLMTHVLTNIIINNHAHMQIYIHIFGYMCIYLSKHKHIIVNIVNRKILKIFSLFMTDYWSVWSC